MAYSQAQNKATQKYQKKAYDRVVYRVPKGYLDGTLKVVAAAMGESVNAFIQKAVDERIEREGL